MPAPEIKDETRYISDLVADLITGHGQQFPGSDPAKVIAGLCFNILALIQVARLDYRQTLNDLAKAARDYVTDVYEATVEEIRNAPSQKVH